MLAGIEHRLVRETGRPLGRVEARPDDRYRTAERDRAVVELHAAARVAVGDRHLGGEQGRGSGAVDPVAEHRCQHGVGEDRRDGHRRKDGCDDRDGDERRDPGQHPLSRCAHPACPRDRRTRRKAQCEHCSDHQYEREEGECDDQQRGIGLARAVEGGGCRAAGPAQERRQCGGRDHEGRQHPRTASHDLPGGP